VQLRQVSRRRALCQSDVSSDESPSGQQVRQFAQRSEPQQGRLRERAPQRRASWQALP